MEKARLITDTDSTKSNADFENQSESEVLENEWENPVETENLTNFETFINICCGITGTGLLAMAFVFRCAGLWAFLIVPTVAIAGNYTGKILIDIMYEHDDKGMKYRAREGYLDIGEALLPNLGKVFVNTVNLVENFAHCILVLLLTGGIMNEIIPIISDDLWTVISCIPLLSIIFLERIRSLARIAIATVLVGFALIILATVYSLRFTENWSSTLKTAKHFDLKGFSLGVGITIVTYACQPYLPFIEKDMKNRGDFGQIMNMTYTLVTIVKIISGFFVYLAYENMTHPLMTLDLPHGWLRTVSSLLLFVIAMTFFVFPMFTVFDIIDQNWPERIKSAEHATAIRHFVRLFTLCLAMVFAVLTPHFGLGIALVGNFTANILVFILPCICHIKFNYPNLPFRYLVIDLIILTTSVLIGAIGIISSTTELIQKSKEPNLNPTEPLQNL